MKQSWSVRMPAPPVQRAGVGSLVRSFGHSDQQGRWYYEHVIALTHPDEGLCPPSPRQRFVVRVRLRWNMAEVYYAKLEAWTRSGWRSVVLLPGGRSVDARPFTDFDGFEEPEELLKAAQRTYEDELETIEFELQRIAVAVLFDNDALPPVEEVRRG